MYSMAKLTCILGGCGMGKTYALEQRIKTDLQADKTVMVLVPEQFSFEAENRLYSHLGARLFDRLQTFSFVTLSHHILQAYGTASRTTSYASEQEKLIYLYEAVKRCAKEDRLRIFGKRDMIPESLTALSGLITKIRKAGLRAEQLTDAVPALPERLGFKTQDIGNILAAYDAILQENGRCDSLVDLTEAAGIAAREQFFKDTVLYIDEFDSFTGDQYQMLAVVLAQALDTCIALRCDDPQKPPTGIFVGGNNTFQQMKRIAEQELHIQTEIQFCDTYYRSARDDLKAVGTQILRRHTKSFPFQGNVHILEAADPAAEVEYICAEISRLLAEQGDTLRCNDIAVAVRSPDVYVPLLERAMQRYALPYDAAFEKPVLHTDMIRYCMGLISILSGREWHTDTILLCLKTNFSGYRQNTVSMLEQYCFTWSIEGEDWELPFFGETAANPERAAHFSGEEIEKLRQDLLAEMTELRKRCRKASARFICEALHTHLSGKMETYPRTPEHVMLWDLLADILDTVVKGFGTKETTVSEIRDCILLLLQSSSFSLPPQTLDSIHIVDAQTARLNGPHIVFVPGVCAGEFPGEVSGNGLFTQTELNTLEAHDLRISRLLPELHSDELLIVNKILASPSEKLYLTYPLLTSENETAVPSPIIDEVKSMLDDLAFPEEQKLFRKDSDLPITFYVYTPASAYYQYVRHLKEDTPETAALREILSQDPAYAARIDRLVKVNTLPDISLRPEYMQPLLGTKLLLSPSGVEEFYTCAFRYFCRYCLKLYVPERVELSSRSIGSFTHYCLEQILRHTDPGLFVHMTVPDLETEIRQLSAQYSQLHFSEAMKRDGRFQFNYRMTEQTILTLLRQLQQSIGTSQFSPAAFEVGITEGPGKNEFPALSLRNGAILCKGKIDRVDICHTDAGDLIRVIDYKTGQKAFSPLKLNGGLDMQMLIYLFALKQSGAFGNAVPGGVLYMPSGQVQANAYELRSSDSLPYPDILKGFYQMKGLMLDSSMPLMEPELGYAAVPVMDCKDEDELFHLTQEQMQHLEQHVEQKLCDMADALHAANITASPYLMQEYTPCKSCSFSGICGRSSENTRTMHQNEKAEALKNVFGSSGKEGKL